MMLTTFCQLRGHSVLDLSLQFYFNKVYGCPLKAHDSRRPELTFQQSNHCTFVFLYCTQSNAEATEKMHYTICTIYYYSHNST